MTLFHQSACEAVDEDALLELIDWCHRKLQYLNSGAAHEHAQAKGARQCKVGALPGTAALPWAGAAVQQKQGHSHATQATSCKGTVCRTVDT